MPAKKKNIVLQVQSIKHVIKLPSVGGGNG